MLYLDLLRNKKLAERRHPMFDQNRFAKFFTTFGAIFMVAYLVFLGVAAAGIITEGWPSMEPVHIFNRIMPFLLLLDFAVRFMIQKPPVQEVKPYILLPVSKSRVVACLCLQTAFGSINLLWFGLLVPFALIAIPSVYGVGGLLGFLLFYWLLYVANNFLYIICRTYVNHSMWYLLVPLLVYGLLFTLNFVVDGYPVFIWAQDYGECFLYWQPLPLMATVALLALLFWLNVRVQLHFIYRELGKTNDTRVKKVRDFAFLERFGEVGQYLKLEIKLQTRNKVPRMQLCMGTLLMLVFSALLAFTDMYDGAMTYFILVYNFVVLGMMTLSQLMCYEGNYLDGLMSRKESVLSILRAKYYFNCLMSLIPFCIMYVPAFSGKFSPIAPVAMYFFTTGICFLIMFQQAVYNKKTMNMNNKVMGKNSGGNSMQMLISFGVMFVPMPLLALSNQLLGDTGGYLAILLLGLAATLLSPLWLRNIYNRFMARRYENMEAFRNSR